MSKSFIEVDYNFKGLSAFVQSFPGLKKSVLSNIAAQGRSLLREKLLSGQTIHLSKKEKDPRGFYLVQGSVNKKNAIVFSSFPVNLFERPHRLRNGKKAPGQYIITRQFKGLLNTKIQSFSDRAFNRIIVKKAGKI